MEDDSVLVDLKPLMYTRMAWDMMPHDSVLELLTELKLTPPSEEGLEQQDRESHTRMNLCVPIIDLLKNYAMMAAKVYIAHQYGEKDDDDVYDRLVLQTYDVVLRAYVGVFSQLFFMGFIDYGPQLQQVVK